MEMNSFAKGVSKLQAQFPEGSEQKVRQRSSATEGERPLHISSTNDRTNLLTLARRRDCDSIADTHDLLPAISDLTGLARGTLTPGLRFEIRVRLERTTQISFYAVWYWRIALDLNSGLAPLCNGGLIDLGCLGTLRELQSARPVK